MTVFLQFFPAASTEARPVPAGPLEFFPSIEAAVREVTGRARDRTGYRAEAAATTAHTARQWRQVRREAAFPQVREGAGGWVALVWWRRAGQTPPRPGDAPGEVWLSVGAGRMERRRERAAVWDTGRGAGGDGRGAGAR